MPDATWEHFPHDADMGVRGIGATLEEAFGQGALALTAVITDPESVATIEKIPIACEAPDPEYLFVDWLNALIYEMATRRLLFSRFEVHILNGNRLTATAWGEPVDREKHQPAVEVKGATMTALKVGQEAPNRWVAQCVVDV
ncbi:archease [Nitrospina gracilis]|uniref:archease n=1 Tax=Nitrospina gracilis TaxID=35801 RepID=UPI001F16C42C|nr:archease [Nitrospina gracilis]MCF8720804.1 SHS2 domain-containing protein [Nitrospina gracilis Nb-211]